MQPAEDEDVDIRPRWPLTNRCASELVAPAIMIFQKKVSYLSWLSVFASMRPASLRSFDTEEQQILQLTLNFQ